MNYVDFNTFHAEIDNKYIDIFGSENMRMYIQFLLIVLGDDFDESGIHVKAKMMDLLFIFNFSNSSKTTALLKEQLVGVDKKTLFLNSLLNFYVQIEFMTDFVSIQQSKYRIRFFMSKFLIKALQEKEFIEGLEKNQGTKQISDFIGHLIADLNYYLEDVFHKFDLIKEEIPKIAITPHSKYFLYFYIYSSIIILL